MDDIDRYLHPDEGLELFAYDDATGEKIVPGYTMVGHPTIGRGRCLDTAGISLAEADYLYDNSKALAIKQAHTFPWFAGLSEARQTVVVCMLYNLGLGRFKGFRRMIAAIERRQFAEAAAEMVESEWRKQVGDRALKLATMMSKGEYPQGEKT